MTRNFRSWVNLLWVLHYAILCSTTMGWPILYFIVEMVFSVITFDVPKCPFGNSTSAATDEFPLIMDDIEDTCEPLSEHGSPYIDVIWTFPLHPSSINQFRVTTSGSQSCKDRNVTWFVRCKDGITECSAEEELTGGLRICHVICKHVCRAVVGYLHFRVQFLSSMNTSLALCHFVLDTDFNRVDPQLRTI